METYSNSHKRPAMQSNYVPSFNSEFGVGGHVQQTQRYQNAQIQQNTYMKESQIKIKQLESDIKLKEMKLQIVQQQNHSRIIEYTETIKYLQEQIQQIHKEKVEIGSAKDDEKAQLTQEINQLEQELIQAKLDVATVKSLLQSERNKALILKRQIKDKNKVEAVQQASKGGKNFDFLKGLKLENKAKAFTEHKENEEEKKQSQGYADYLLGHQEQISLIKSSPEKARLGKIVLEDVEPEEIKVVQQLASMGKKEDKVKVQELDEDMMDDDDERLKVKEAIQSITKGINESNSSQYDKDRLRKWVENYIPKIEQMKNDNKLLEDKKFRDEVQKGIPTELRGLAWQKIVGNDLRVTEKLYEILLERAKLCEQNIEKDQFFRKNLKVIEEDLHRTFGELGHFRYGNKLYQPLKNILIAFSVIAITAFLIIIDVSS